MKPFYQGEAYSPQQIIAMLRSQGLTIDDETRALEVLSNVSYSRLKNYLIALMKDRKSHRFHPGTTFEQAYALYGFDRRLRELIFHEMEKIEISIRTRIAFLCNGQEKGYWFLNASHFKTQAKHESILRHLKSELERSDNEGILHFMEKYSNEFPPSWLALEAASMGTLVRIYEDLADEGLRERIASFYGMSATTFLSWVRHLLSIRNNCAHHNRVWNAEPPVKAGLPVGLEYDFPSMRDGDRYHVYMTLCIVKYFIDRIKPNNTFGARLKMLIGNFAMVDPSLMGFPHGWDKSEYWK